MKNIKFLSKPFIFVLLISMPLFLFAGCQAKSITSTTTNKDNFAATMKKQLQTSIQSLIDAKTITKDQGTKIVDALTANTGGGNGKGTPPTGAAPTGTPPTDTQPTGTPPTGTTDSNGANTGTSPGTPGDKQNGQSTALAKLVTEKVITQAQSDAVAAKIKTALQPPQNNQSTTTAQ